MLAILNLMLPGYRSHKPVVYQLPNCGLSAVEVDGASRAQRRDFFKLIMRPIRTERSRPSWEEIGRVGRELASHPKEGPSRPFGSYLIYNSSNTLLGCISLTQISSTNHSGLLGTEPLGYVSCMVDFLHVQTENVPLEQREHVRRQLLKALIEIIEHFIAEPGPYISLAVFAHYRRDPVWTDGGLRLIQQIEDSTADFGFRLVYGGFFERAVSAAS